MSEDAATRSARARSPAKAGGDGTAEAASDEDALRSLLASPRDRERRDAALALVDRADDAGLAPETVDALADRLADEAVADVRQFAVEALGVGAGEGADGASTDPETAVRTALRDDPDEWVRAEAVVALSRLAPDDDAIADALDDDSGWVRRNAVIALGKTGRATPAQLTDRVKTDPHPAVREYAAGYLGERATDGEVADAVRVLAALLARDPEAFVRAKAAEALGDLATDRAEQALESHGVTDRSDDVERAATRALAAARGADPDSLDVGTDDGPPGGGPRTRPDAPGGNGAGGPACGGPRAGGNGAGGPPTGSPGSRPAGSRGPDDAGSSNDDTTGDNP